jgi:hypothetical protein
MLAATTLGGCAARETAWDWPASDASAHASAMPATVGGGDGYVRQVQPRGDRRVLADSLDQGVAVFPSWGFAEAAGPEESRLDSRLAVRTPDALPNRLAWPTAGRPDLRYQEVFRISSRADIYRFPGDRRDRPRRVIVPVPVPVFPAYPRPYPRSPWYQPGR